MHARIIYRAVERLSPEDFVDVLIRSSLAERRPVGDLDRIRRMIAGANVIIGAFDPSDDRLVGVARSLTDFAYCCYISDLAVDRAYQRRGIGRRLIEITRTAAGPEATCLLVSAPEAKPFYEAIGMPNTDLAFLYKRDR